MILRHKKLVIPKEKGSDPFENCKLERKKYAQILSNIVANYADGFVLAINNPWGEGKTTFVEMWKQSLKNDGYTTLYFNAWKNDFESDVLIALISEISEIENKPEESFKKVLNRAIPLTKKIIPLAAKHISKKMIGEEATTAFVEGFAEYTADELKKEITKHTEKKNSIDDFKNNLEVFIQEISPDKPIVFIVDELDRCKPNYAVEVLEQIKHLFSVPGIIFVLSIDKIQLGHAVRGYYGNDQIDSQEYLRRFIDVEYSIPKPDMYLLCRYFYDYFGFPLLIKNTNRNRIFQNEGTDLVDFSISLFGNITLSIRQIEKLFSHTRLAFTSFGERESFFPRLCILLVFIKQNHFELYNLIKNRKIKLQNLIDEVEAYFPEKLQDRRHNNSILYAIVELSISYHNFYFENAYNRPELFSKDITNNKVVINISSKFDKTENKADLIHIYESLKYKIVNDSIKINNITNKLDLLEPIR